MEPADANAARLLQERLLESHQEWSENLFVDLSGNLPILTLVLPHCRKHELSIEICRTEATVAYSDGIPPGPAEAVFVWGDDPLGKGLDAVFEHIAALVQGKVILVRERLPRVVQFVRGHDCDSLLWFVPIDEFKGWSSRRQRRVLRIWSWDEARQFAI
jgi:hypothetical protein